MVLPVSSGLQLKDQFVNLLEISTKVVNSATTQLERANRKKQKADNALIGVNITVEDIEVVQSLHAEEETACKASVAELLQEIKRLRAENQKFAESQQQRLENQQRLMHKQTELVEIVQRLQSRQDINGRLLCTVYDRQRFPGEHALFNQQTEGTSC
ncbi:hypothetical protein PPTG_05136 [Phytophthora nicotianae INRA-310]|uniref:Uncharacterized protein n=1 Tax=Phytophthora nicotianae (strain INRA-310) TaxID=761204 RepID=W2QVS3_PHYN3|nr:hypothetical protein PPTG_05136 [Phytophthora nicotianae INRA-310]ETN17307.1 hypothetical protein PPTG_05136 [Phytophthora nicotianae INRA-310]